MVKVYRKDLEDFYDVSPGRAKELVEEGGYSYSPVDYDLGGDATSAPSANDLSEGIARANQLFNFMPETIKNKFAQSWVKF